MFWRHFVVFQPVLRSRSKVKFKISFSYWRRVVLGLAKYNKKSSETQVRYTLKNIIGCSSQGHSKWLDIQNGKCSALPSTPERPMKYKSSKIYCCQSKVFVWVCLWSVVVSTGCEFVVDFAFKSKWLLASWPFVMGKWSTFLFEGWVDAIQFQ